MKREPTIRITEQELYELTKGAITHTDMCDPIRFSSKLRYEVARHFRLVSSMSKPSTINRKGSVVFLVAGIGFLALAVKIFAENFWRIH